MATAKRRISRKNKHTKTKGKSLTTKRPAKRTAKRLPNRRTKRKPRTRKRILHRKRSARGGVIERGARPKKAVSAMYTTTQPDNNSPVPDDSPVPDATSIAMVPPATSTMGLNNTTSRKKSGEQKKIHLSSLGYGINPNLPALNSVMRAIANSSVDDVNNLNVEDVQAIYTQWRLGQTSERTVLRKGDNNMKMKEERRYLQRLVSDKDPNVLRRLSPTEMETYKQIMPADSEMIITDTTTPAGFTPIKTRPPPPKKRQPATRPVALFPTQSTPSSSKIAAPEFDLKADDLPDVSEDLDNWRM